MTMTPWGDSGALRERRLPPGRGLPREQVLANQRERLYAAMVAVVAEKGYAETSVADLVELSGVSSRSFYELFADKESAFLATMEELLAGTQGPAIARFGSPEPTPAYLAHIVATFVSLAASQPAAARLVLISAFAAGERAQERIERALEESATVFGAILGALPGYAGTPPEIVRAILGGIAGTLYRRLAEGGGIAGREELAAGLGRWALSIPPPPRPLRARGRRRAPVVGPPPFAAHVPGERVLRSFSAVVAERGLAQTTIAAVAAEAQISQNTFYAHFRDKADAFEAALDSSGAQLVAATLPAVRRNRRWPEAMRVALEAMFGFLAAEPDFAYLREVETAAAGPEAVAKRESTQEEIMRLLEELAEPVPDLDPLASEASVAAIRSLIYRRVRAGGAASLPELVPLATYIFLAPSLGAERAAEVAVG
jgi:AcrR family transcriptional regulator